MIEYYFVWDNLIICCGTLKECITAMIEYKNLYGENHEIKLYKVEEISLKNTCIM